MRLACIDAPELKQPFGKASRDHLRAIIKDRPVKIDRINTDRFGRTIAILYISDGVNGAQCNRYKLHLAQLGHLIDLKEIARSGIRSIGNSKPPNQKKSAYSQTGRRSSLGHGGKMKSLDKSLDES
ncbi:thermonuclease family protein, partial [Microcystis aeruginosa]|uniref:thermonuclease family protein n=1 Tax=Microcystis aeruginosa TaxID=1126 RepID=UPI0034D323CC